MAVNTSTTPESSSCMSPNRACGTRATHCPVSFPKAEEASQRAVKISNDNWELELHYPKHFNFVKNKRIKYLKAKPFRYFNCT
jgi:hypothetical protein